MPSGGRIKRSRKVLAESQEATNLKRYQAAPAMIRGRFTLDQIVTDGQDLYRVISHGIRCHEDSPDLMYGVQKIRATPEWSATEFLRHCVALVIRKGTHEPGSRGIVGRKRAKALPASYAADFTWRDAKPGSLVMPDTVSVHGTCVRVVHPISDDAPSIAWLDDAQLCERVRTHAAIAPTPPDVPVVQVIKRSMRRMHKQRGGGHMSDFIEQLASANARAQAIYAAAWTDMMRAQRELAIALRAFVVTKAALDNARGARDARRFDAAGSCVIAQDGHCIGGSLIGETCPHDVDR